MSNNESLSTNNVHYFPLLNLLSLPVYGQSGSEGMPPYKLTEIKIRPYNQTTNSFLDDITNELLSDLRCAAQAVERTRRWEFFNRRCVGEPLKRSV
jgi:hypothetical protein